ncbi:MAG TPA: hypothetical protein VFC78_09810 [Tepidisphaeraceae bacterium]|nr:hypothetical protein [Tepidisphaeraceae bacterium]
MAVKSRSAVRRKLKVGDHVVLHLGERDVFADVVEDRGFIGVGGRQLVAIRRTGVGPELSEPYEVPAEELELDLRKTRSTRAKQNPRLVQRVRA